jgi:hypothetical protein
VQLAVDALAMLGDVLRVRRWAVNGGYDRAISVVPDPSLASGLGAEIGQAAQPS